ncbi:hypothetical protein ACFVFH_29720 [Streptomyces sp. NPDC057697]|uniref:hypothetical protein n=1 Tax=Streptomyces sp. NPDC057697 TaxID=3346219 RepID=UPI0036CD6E16
MMTQTRKKKPVIVASVALVVVATLLSLYCWWNTNLFGADSFCGGRMGSGEVRAALDSTGRVSQVYAQVDPQRAEFECTVERTSRFVGSDDQQVTVGTKIEKGAFPFTTHVWKNPGARSYFRGGVTGAVAQDGGYVVLPKSCWDKGGALQGKGVVRFEDGAVATVEAKVEKGAADPAGLARLLIRSARQVAEKAGCSTSALSAAPDLAAPSASRTTDVQNVCGVRGFTLPKAAVLVTRAEPDLEQVNEGSADTWACDLSLAGSAKAAMSFAATSDKNFVEVAKKDMYGLETLPGDKGVAGIDEAVLHCGRGDVHFAAKRNVAYDKALHDSTRHDGIADMRVERAMFQNFLDATAAAHSCPRVTLPQQKDRS